MRAGNGPVAVVAVPVRNEGAWLQRLLLALAVQREAPSFALCVFFDACTDNSRAVVSALAGSLPFPITCGCDAGENHPNAGRARAMAATFALAAHPEAALLTTDADSEPDPGWIAANLSALGRADVVAGRILLDDPGGAPIQARLIRYHDRLHARRRIIDPVAWEDEVSHHWTSGASMAFSPAAYEALGGFAPVPRGEDADIADRAWRLGLRLRRDARATVRTSSRRQGRAPGGFATSLAALDEAADLPLVSHPDDELWRYRRHADARLAFEADMPHAVSALLRLDAAELRLVADECANADAFAARVVGVPPGGMRQVSLAHAEVLLGMTAEDELEEVA